MVGMGGPRDFDPVRLGRAGCYAWTAYYRRDWRGVLTSAGAWSGSASA